MQKCLVQIAGLTFQIEHDSGLQIEPKFQVFCKDLDNADYTIRFQRVNTLPLLPKKVISRDLNYKVYEAGEGCFLRSFSDYPWDDTPYAVAKYDYSSGLIQVDYLEKGAHAVSHLSNSFGHLNFEELLLRKGRLCLHASCVDTALGGILFSGQSGIGKSTQSELWCQYRGAKLINGDRPILSQSGSGWLAWGSPYAGSSKCHVNENCPVRAIVMLQKGPTCEIRRLSLSEAYRKVWTGLTVHTWDASYVTAALDLAQALVESVPVYEMTCTPDEQAVLCLEDALRRECEP